jgi:hypothetical protein
MDKTIEMVIRQGSSVISFRDALSDEATWMAQAYLFHKFLLAQGYTVEPDQVGADVDDYVAATEVSKEW